MLLVCPQCERRSVDRESRLKIRQSGHYELTCQECRDKVSLIGAMTSRWQSSLRNLKRINEQY